MPAKAGIRANMGTPINLGPIVNTTYHDWGASISAAYSGIYDDYILQKVGTLVGYSGRVFGITVTLNGKQIRLLTPVPKQYQGDKSDFSMFTESRANIQNNLQEASLDLAGLAIWNLILAMLAFAAISHCDVR